MGFAYFWCGHFVACFYSLLRDAISMIEIWCEGDPLRDLTACHLGTGKGSSLEEACADYATKNQYFAAHIRVMKYKGCKLFDNEEEARQSFG